MRQEVNIEDFRTRARRSLPRVVFDFLDGGAESEITLHRNRSAFDDIRLKPRILKGGDVDLSVTLFGQKYAAPFQIGPTVRLVMVDAAIPCCRVVVSQRLRCRLLIASEVVPA